MRRRMYQRLRSYWWVWLLLAVAVAVLNELFDRKVAGDQKGHPGGDVLVAIVIVLVVAFVWETVAHRRRSV